MQHPSRLTARSVVLPYATWSDQLSLQQLLSWLVVIILFVVLVVLLQQVMLGA